MIREILALVIVALMAGVLGAKAADAPNSTPTPAQTVQTPDAAPSRMKAAIELLNAEKSACENSAIAMQQTVDQLTAQNKSLESQIEDLKKKASAPAPAETPKP